MPEDQPFGEIQLYNTTDGQTRVECRFLDETLWLSQAQMAELYQKDVRTINEHLLNIFEEGEVDSHSVIRNFRITAADGKKYGVQHYNLDAILAVGFRVRSKRGTQFRRWAIERLNEYLVKGFTMDDKRLKNPPVDGSGIPDHFDELLERIRDIRTSEKRVYLRVRDIFALADDYESGSKGAKPFFQAIQNTLHFAITGKTAPELIAGRVDHSKPNMGLTSWEGERVLKRDVKVAKNYLNDAEIDGLNRIVNMWLEFAEDQSKRRKQVFLSDWETKLADFLKLNDRDVLTGRGKIKKSQADEKAAEEYEKFAQRRRELAEAEGERMMHKALEKAAKKLPINRQAE